MAADVIIQSRDSAGEAHLVGLDVVIPRGVDDDHLGRPAAHGIDNFILDRQDGLHAWVEIVPGRNGGTAREKVEPDVIPIEAVMAACADVDLVAGRSATLYIFDSGELLRLNDEATCAAELGGPATRLVEGVRAVGMQEVGDVGARVGQ